MRTTVTAVKHGPVTQTKMRPEGRADNMYCTCAANVSIVFQAFTVAAPGGAQPRRLPASAWTFQEATGVDHSSMQAALAACQSAQGSLFTNRRQ